MTSGSRGLTTSEAGKRLGGRATANVRRSASAKDLYAYPRGPQRELVFPEWQFVDDRPLTGLRQVLGALPTTMHPVAVERWMTTPREELDDLSAVAWLAGGGDVDVVVWLADSLAPVTSKSPSALPGPLEVEDLDLRIYSGPLFRIHATTGRQPSRWNQLRTWGPANSRWDPHPLPPGEHPHHCVLYAATDTSTAFGEIFQDDRIIDLHEDTRYLTGWRPLRALVLLDLTDTWPLRNGATFDLSTAEKETCRAWARAIHAELSLTVPWIDGLYTRSTITGRPVVTLFGHGDDSLPTAPELSRSLDHDDLVLFVEQAKADTGFEVVG